MSQTRPTDFGEGGLEIGSVDPTEINPWLKMPGWRVGRGLAFFFSGVSGRVQGHLLESWVTPVAPCTVYPDMP